MATVVIEKEYENLGLLLAELNTNGVTGYRRYQAVKRHLTLKARKLATPISGTFELTPLCNLDCKMCYVHLHRDQLKDKTLLPVETWLGLIDDAVKHGMLYAKLTGGECLTYPHFREVYLHLSALGVEVSVLTNGTLLTDEMVSFFKEHPPACLQVTLYGSDDDAYERVTGNRAFSDALEGILRVQATDLPLVVVVTPNRFMVDDAEKLLALAHRINPNFSLNAGLFTAREETGRDRESFDLSLDETIQIMRIRADLDGLTNDPCSEEDLPKPATGTAETVGIQCSAGRHGFSIAWDGIMRGCNVLCEFESEPLKDGFAQAWKTINEIATRFPLPTECNGCHYEPACKKCIAEHCQGAEKGHANPAVCAWAQRMVREGLRNLPDMS